MERLTKKERVGLIVFSAIVAIGVAVSFGVKRVSFEPASSINVSQSEILEFEKQVLERESDSVHAEIKKSKNKVKSKNVYQEIDPLKDKLDRNK